MHFTLNPEAAAFTPGSHDVATLPSHGLWEGITTDSSTATLTLLPPTLFHAHSPLPSVFASTLRSHTPTSDPLRAVQLNVLAGPRLQGIHLLAPWLLEVLRPHRFGVQRVQVSVLRCGERVGEARWALYPLEFCDFAPLQVFVRGLLEVFPRGVAFEWGHSDRLGEALRGVFACREGAAREAMEFVPEGVLKEMARRFEGVRGAQVCEWGEDSVVHPDEPFWDQLQGVMEVQDVLIAQGWGSEDGWVGEKTKEEDAGDETSEKKVGKKWGKKGIKKKGKPAIDKSENQSDPQRMGKNQREAQCDGDRKKGKKGQNYKKNKKMA